jgi:hypothetical protein
MYLVFVSKGVSINKRKKMDLRGKTNEYPFLRFTIMKSNIESM